MSVWETIGASDEWYTPAYIFDALGEEFDLDVAAPPQGGPHVPTKKWFSEHSLMMSWHGFIWMNPPFGGPNGLVPWLDKFFLHGHGIALTPDRTSSAWWQDAARSATSLLLIDGRVKFIRPDGTVGQSPSNGVTLFAAGERADLALCRAANAGLGIFLRGAT